MTTATNKIETYGFIQAMDGDELWINTPTDERITVKVNDRDLRWNLYCKHVKITIEEVSEQEVNSALQV